MPAGLSVENLAVENLAAEGVFGWAVDSEKAAVSCELWKSYCELSTVDYLEVIWL
jgi:hypothetical protein